MKTFLDCFLFFVVIETLCLLALKNITPTPVSWIILLNQKPKLLGKRYRNEQLRDIEISGYLRRTEICNVYPIRSRIVFVAATGYCM